MTPGVVEFWVDNYWRQSTVISLKLILLLSIEKLSPLLRISSRISSYYCYHWLFQRGYMCPYCVDMDKHFLTNMNRNKAKSANLSDNKRNVYVRPPSFSQYIQYFEFHSPQNLKSFFFFAGWLHSKVGLEFEKVFCSFQLDLYYVSSWKGTGFMSEKLPTHFISLISIKPV